MNFSCSLLLRKSFITDVLQGTYATMDNHLPDFLRNASTVYVYAQFDRDLLKGCQIFWSFLMKYFWSKSEKWIYSNKGTSKFGTTVPFLSYRKFVNSTQFTLMKLWLLMQLAFYSKKSQDHQISFKVNSTKLSAMIRSETRIPFCHIPINCSFYNTYKRCVTDTKNGFKYY